MIVGPIQCTKPQPNSANFMLFRERDDKIQDFHEISEESDDDKMHTNM